MGVLSTILLSTDITVLGHFNPAILRHEFLTQVCEFGFASPVNSSPADIFVVSEIQYDKVRWFMDFDRMVVQNLQMQGPTDFTAPQLAEKYLTVLPHTPILAAGFNILADFELSDGAILWENLLRGDKIHGIINRFGGQSTEIISRMGLSASGGELLEATLIYNSQPEGRFQLGIAPLDKKKVVRCTLNFEVRGMEDRNKFSPFVKRSDAILTDFIELMTVFSERI